LQKKQYRYGNKPFNHVTIDHEIRFGLLEYLSCVPYNASQIKKGHVFFDLNYNCKPNTLKCTQTHQSITTCWMLQPLIHHHHFIDHFCFFITKITRLKKPRS
jgi:hypothetical protein